jgi:hypothetical protein
MESACGFPPGHILKVVFIKRIPVLVFSIISKSVCTTNVTLKEMPQKYMTTPVAKCNREN